MRSNRRLPKPALPLAILLLFDVACGGRGVNRHTAQQLIRELPVGLAGKDDVQIESISEVGGRHAIVEARLRAAFKLEKVQGRWVAREVRIGEHPWEKIDALALALEASRVDETRRRLERVAAAIESFVRSNGALPDFASYTALSDLLHPSYLNPLVREDAWGRPLAAVRADAETVRLISAGPDGQLGSADDLVVTRSFRR
jgi:hypothetical protein